MPEQTDRQLLQETHDAVIELSAVVLGVKGQGGLVQDMSEVKMSVNSMKLKTDQGEHDVVELLKKVTVIDDEMHKDEGVCDTLSRHDEQIKGNNNLIKALWAVLSAAVLSLIGLIITKVLK